MKGGKVIEIFFGLNEIHNKTEADHREAVLAEEKRSKFIPGGVPYVMGAERDLVLVYMMQVLASNATLVAIWSFVYMTTACWHLCNFKYLRTGSRIKSFDNTTVLLAEHPA